MYSLCVHIYMCVCVCVCVCVYVCVCMCVCVRTYIYIWIMEPTFDTALMTLSLQPGTKVKTDIVNEFLFAEDCALNATIKANMQNSVDKFSMACDNFGLTISTKKTSDAAASAWKNMSSPTSLSWDND